MTFFSRSSTMSISGFVLGQIKGIDYGQDGIPGISFKERPETTM